jgi:hypothetical protein
MTAKILKIGTATKADNNHYLAVHELEDLSKAFRSQQQHEEASTPRMERHIEASEKKGDKGGGFVRRGWTLVHAEGYQLGADGVQVEPDEREEFRVVNEGGWLGLKSILTRLLGYDGI